MIFPNYIKSHLVVKIVVMTVAYSVTAALSFSLKIEGSTFIPYWPPSGVAFALAILLGRSVWPGIFIGTMLVSSFAQWYDPQQAIGTSIGITTFVATSNVVELFVGMLFMKHWVKTDYPFYNTRNSFRFIFIVLLMSMAGALVGAIGQWIFVGLTFEKYLRTVFSWWMESTVGLLSFTPFLLSIAQKSRVTISQRMVKELAIFAGIIIIILVLLRVPSFHSTLVQGLPFLVLPFLLWLSFRFSLATVSSCLLGVSFLAIYFTMNKIGPFVLANASDSSLLLQLFFGVLVLR